MLTYNTQLKPLVLPEYGRNIQQMVDHCLTLNTREERTACAHTIIKTMLTLFPAQGNADEYRRKLWDHLAIMSGFELDIDWPYEVIQPDSLHSQPAGVPYEVNDIRHRHYGKTMELMIDHASAMAPGEERDALILLLANHMKKLMLAVNPEGVDDAKIFKDLLHMSHGAINLNPAEVHLHEFRAAPAPVKKKKKK